MNFRFQSMLATVCALVAAAAPLPSVIAVPAALAAIAVPAPAAATIAQPVVSETRGLRIKYEDGFVELIRVVYTAQLQIDEREDGGPAIPLKGRFVDDRRCNWRIDSAISRKIVLVSRSGAEYVSPDVALPYQSGFANEGSAFVLTQLRPEPCSQTKARMASDMQNARQHLAKVTPAVADKDFRAVTESLRRNPKVKSISTFN